MTLQASGAISLAQVQTEHGGANPISMSEYYRGVGIDSTRAVAYGSWTIGPTRGPLLTDGVKEDPPNSFTWGVVWDSIWAFQNTYIGFKPWYVTQGSVRWYGGYSLVPFLAVLLGPVRRDTYSSGVYYEDVNTGVPTSGKISMSQFYNTTNY